MDINDLKKQFNDFLREAHENARLDYCLCCKNKVDGFCNSHSLPEFILKNISDQGLVYTSNKFFKAPIIKDFLGLSNSGTFKRICHKCDNEVFQNYEDPNKIGERPSKKVLAQIDLKNTLRMYDKRLNEIALYNLMLSKKPPLLAQYEMFEKQRVNLLDLNEIKSDCERALNILDNKSSDSYELIYWEKLDYVVPIAFQGHVALQGDLEGNEINDLYAVSDKYIIENLNICIFPLEQTSIVMIFVAKENKKYAKFIKQFKKLSKSNKLNLIAFIIFNYSEDFFISKKVSDELLNNPILEVVTQNISDITALDKKMASDIIKFKMDELKLYSSFPNVLDKEFSINRS